MNQNNSENLLSLVAKLVEYAPLRYTPAGIEVLTLTLSHQSKQFVAQGLAERQVELHIKAQLFGQLANKAQKLVLGQTALFKGYLAPTRAGSKALWFMITSFETVDFDASTTTS